MAIAVLAIFALFVLGTSRRAVVPGRAQSLAEILYSFIHKMVEDVAGQAPLHRFQGGPGLRRAQPTRAEGRLDGFDGESHEVLPEASSRPP